jgi:hypothetical protein
MAVNQAQVDHILSSASADDPEVKVQKLQDEVDLIKVSIKRLLIDIRERMNELENPFVHAVNGTVPPAVDDTTAREQAAAGRETAMAAREATAAVRDGKIEQPGRGELLSQGGSNSSAEPGVTQKKDVVGILPEYLVEALKAQLVPKPVQKPGTAAHHDQEKLRLTKVHHLFEWTSRMVKKYGHDRLDLMLQSYRAMGYLTRESCEQVKEISRLMPSGLGESHDISPGEFIQELYALNRILDPSDTSLDRDMIEVLMEQRKMGKPVKDEAPVEREGQDTWARMPDGI